MLIPQAIVQTGAATLASVDATMSGDVTMVNANTFYDGPSVSLTAGTWFVSWKLQFIVLVTTVQTYVLTGRLWDGSTSYDEQEYEPTNSTANQQGAVWFLQGFAIVTLAAPTTLKASAANVRGSSSTKIARDTDTNSATTHTASRVTALQIA